MKTLRNLLLLAFTIIAFAPSSTKAQGGSGSAQLMQEMVELYTIGVNTNWNLNNFSADFQRLSDEVPSCCPKYTEGSGNGLTLGLAYSIPLAKRWSLAFRGAYSSQSGTLKTQERQSVSSASNQTVTGIIEHSIETTLATLNVEPMVAYSAIDNLKVHFGGRLGVTVTKDYVQTEFLSAPSNLTFENKSRTRNLYSGEIPGTNTLQASLLMGVSYEIPLTIAGTVNLSPEIFYNFGLTSLVSGLNWNVNQLRVGVSINYTNKIPKAEYELMNQQAAPGN